jgi:hypothetical protein
MLITLLSIIRSPKYSLPGIFGASFIFIFSVILPNYRLFVSTLREGLLFNLKLIYNLILSSPNSLGFRSLTYIILLSVLFGLTFSVYIYYFKKRLPNIKLSAKSTSSGTLGFLSGLLGIGCVSCGTVILSGLIGFAGVASFLSFLPFGGEEFAWLGILLLSLSFYLALKKTSDPQVCFIER